jgi:glycerol-3-phosphate dehydrogenase
MVEGVNERDLITSFSGSRPVIEDKEDFFIAISEKAPNFIQAAGILSPGLTAAPAVAEYIIELLVKANLTLTKKSTPLVYPAKVPKVRNLKAQEVAKLAEQDPAWANIICRCEKVSEYEIRNAIRKGHTTLDGVKLATRAGMGRCKSGFCALKLMHLIADETGMSMEEIIKRENASKVISGKLEDFRQ